MESITFTVAMNNEEKKAGNTKDVKFDIDFKGVPEELIRKHAIANMKVHWQSQIRNNWDKFLEGKLPEVIPFGQPLFESTRKVAAPMTPEAAKKVLESLTPEAREALLASLNI